ncbi:MAG TPA: PilZ domain-containing protein [Hyphomicrobium sp.]|nr:PilZ domain-containing protein [Hyphomicrobium sp.]
MRSIDRILSKRSTAASEALEGKASEKRFAPRRTAMTPAVVYLEDGPGSFPCLIRDMSTTGARLELREGWDNPFSSGVSIDDRIRLVVRMDRVMYECRIVRRGASELGVKFTAAPKALARAARAPEPVSEKVRPDGQK